MKIEDAARLARHAGKYANVESAKRFATHVVPEVVRPARVIWNQAIGALFFVLAIPALVKAVQLYRDLKTDPSKSSFGLLLAAIFVTVMVIFGIASFVKARRIAAQIPNR